MSARLRAVGLLGAALWLGALAGCGTPPCSGAACADGGDDGGEGAGSTDAGDGGAGDGGTADGGAGDAGEAPCLPGAECRPAAGPCDVAEVCEATGRCPADARLDAGVRCRASRGGCDVEEVCSGDAAGCPFDRQQPAAFACRVATGPCDVTERCAGDADDCPADLLAAAGSVCRPVAGACDVGETCSGVSAGCPADVGLPVGTVCRASRGSCDLAEACQGGPGCPPDVVVDAGVVCRPAVDGGCDVAERCDGVAGECPANGFEPPSKVCGAASCTNGTFRPTDYCVGHSAVCLDASPVSCAPSTCLPDGGAGCNTSCVTQNDCSPSTLFYCLAGRCTQRVPKLGSCTPAADGGLEGNSVSCTPPNRCLRAYTDADLDGFGTGPVKYLCVDNLKQNALAATPNDCCDGDDRANPARTAFFAAKNNCNSFDYDCSGAVENQVPAVQVCRTMGVCPSVSCNGTGAGWFDPVPACGVSAIYAPSGCGEMNDSSCPSQKRCTPPPLVTSRQQLCH